MHYLPKELQREYDYYLEHTPDVADIKKPLINVSDTLRAYFILADYFTDPSSEQEEQMLIGVRDRNLLASAIGRQTISFDGKRKYTDAIDICATLFFGMVKNHSFSDGNKRTALLILLYQLTLYGYVPSAPKKDFERLVVAVAANEIPNAYPYEWKKCIDHDDPIVATIARLLRKYTKKKDHTYHASPTIKEFCEAIQATNTTYSIRGHRLHFERRVKSSRLFKKDEVYQYYTPFSGWTRIVGAETARKILKSLNLYEEYANYQDFLTGAEPMYQIVQEFSGPLRRLKDK